VIAIEPSAPGEKSLSERVVALLRELASELHPEHPGIDALDANASIERDFGLDSLARGELAQRLEKELGIALPEAAVAEAETALDLVLSNPGVKSLVVNFCGAFARTDVMAEGVVRAWEALKPTVPVFFSIHGTGEERAVALVRQQLSIEPYDLMEDAVQAAVEAAR